MGDSSISDMPSAASLHTTPTVTSAVPVSPLVVVVAPLRGLSLSSPSSDGQLRGCSSRAGAEASPSVSDHVTSYAHPAAFASTVLATEVERAPASRFYSSRSATMPTSESSASRSMHERLRLNLRHP
ncbi:hypothetical protein AMTR_s00020p00029490 [Amborella trichopoda]|uniref:Uncharacterized protein n=1 Tax=Amborella trichopoda TaxID=13333 RepID=W1PVG8_AMBTC|nr:hypothetical protein AMTR_s00020p00029490 [Amborella trichopoda]